jgi:hypothetical protein
MAFETSQTILARGPSEPLSTQGVRFDVPPGSVQMGVPPLPPVGRSGSAPLDEELEPDEQLKTKTASGGERHLSGKDVSRFSVRQFFEGVVTAVNERDGTFTATIVDRTDSTLPDEAVEIGRSEVDDQDWELIAPGACFYWYIGYKTANRGRERVGEIRFRRLPRLTESELLEGRRRVASSRLKFE